MAAESGNLDELCVNTIRMLAVDMVEAANSGHPGLPLGAAPMAYVVWDRFLRHNPANPAWPGRDRFILSAGHGSALLYALLHLTGYQLSLDDLKNFRQWGSLTPGHPEYGVTPGVECTTGPLGQGFAMGVGMALAQRHLAATYNQPDFPLFDHYIYALVSDGDLMEGVAAEAASLAGTLGLDRLIYLYDDNHISIEGDTEITFTEDVAARFIAYGWQVLEVGQGEDLETLTAAIQEARAEDQRPSLIKVRSHLGYGSPKQDQPSAHGEPLGPEARAATRRRFNWPDQDFHVPPQVREYMGRARERGAQAEAAWQKLWEGYTQAHPRKAAELKARLAGELPADWRQALPGFTPDQGPLATRAASGKVLNALAPVVPALVGGSADLAPSNKTMISGSGDMRGRGAECGRNIHFGVREHAMAAMVNGMALHGGVIPYAGTFFVFSDYMRPALRLAALMKTHGIFIFTHDSVGVGEDGPTHQPVEHLAALRVMPGITVIRPADAVETAAAWALALEADHPVALVLSRQKLPILDDPQGVVAAGVARGAYVLAESQGELELIIMATGAEVHLALEARRKLQEQGVGCRVVSMPSWELFSSQDQAYQDQVLPPAVSARLSIEAGATMGWERWLGNQGLALGLDRFGASAPGPEALARLGFNLDNVLARARQVLEKRAG